MLIDNAQKGNTKRAKVLIVIFVVLTVATAGVFIWQKWFIGAEEDLTGSLVPGRVSGISADFQMAVLEDDRVQALKMHGPVEVQAVDRGQNAAPFEAF